MSDATDVRAPLESDGHEPMSESQRLPIWRDNLRGAPTAFLRSALFTCADKRKPRKVLHNKLLSSVKGQHVWYSGTELRQNDLTVWLHLVHLLRQLPLGKTILVYPLILLEGLGWGTSSASYEQLRSSIARLVGASVRVERPYRPGFSGCLLVANLETAASAGRRLLWKFSLDQDLHWLYSHGAFTLLDPEERRLLTPLAQWLYGFHSSLQSPYPYKASSIQELCGSTSQSPAGFMRNLIEGMEQLKENSLIFNYVVDGAAIRPLARRPRHMGNDDSVEEQF